MCRGAGADRARSGLAAPPGQGVSASSRWLARDGPRSSASGSCRRDFRLPSASSPTAAKRATTSPAAPRWAQEPVLRGIRCRRPLKSGMRRLLQGPCCFAAALGAVPVMVRAPSVVLSGGWPKSVVAAKARRGGLSACAHAGQARRDLNGKPQTAALVRSSPLLGSCGAFCEALAAIPRLARQRFDVHFASRAMATAGTNEPVGVFRWS